VSSALTEWERGQGVSALPSKQGSGPTAASAWIKVACRCLVRMRHASARAVGGPVAQRSAVWRALRLRALRHLAPTAPAPQTQPTPPPIAHSPIRRPLPLNIILSVCTQPRSRPQGGPGPRRQRPPGRRPRPRRRGSRCRRRHRVDHHRGRQGEFWVARWPSTQ
jgi:hypothetical protein